ncbi:MAG: fructosamine kinase family protein [Actinomycetaceae bacterium]|nr:fructosamine kinase family protein [Actinomycetaceae bacterium]
MSARRSGNVFVKTDSANPTSVELEALGLQWLAEGMGAGGAHVVPVEGVKRGELSTRAVQGVPVSEEAAFQFGRALALTHATGAEFHGQAPGPWEGDGWMGAARLIFAREGEHDSWGEFFAEERILPHLPAAVDSGAIPRGGVRVVERVCERLRDGDFDAPQPELVEAPASRIHGDLWSGNVIWARASELDWAPPRAGFGTSEEELPEVVGVLIDPAASGGHAEKDLADLGVFGQRYLEEIYAGYEAESKLEPGWQERISLHQLHILMVHAELFGGHYGNEVVLASKKYV